MSAYFPARVGIIWQDTVLMSLMVGIKGLRQSIHVYYLSCFHNKTTASACLLMFFLVSCILLCKICRFFRSNWRCICLTTEGVEQLFALKFFSPKSVLEFGTEHFRFGKHHLEQTSQMLPVNKSMMQANQLTSLLWNQNQQSGLASLVLELWVLEWHLIC